MFFIEKIKKMLFLKRLKDAFKQGEHNKRYDVLKAISEIIYNEYTEDNFFSRFTWLVEELLISDPVFAKNLYRIDVQIETLKRGLEQSVDEARRLLMTRKIGEVDTREVPEG